MLILIILLPVPASVAEYRAYELLIEDVESGKQRKVVTTLDHLQYPTYYPLSNGEKVSYLNSWMCHQNTGDFKDICQSPEKDRAPSSKKGARN